MFFVAFLPQFISPGAPVTPQLWILATTFVVMATLNATLYAAFAASARSCWRRPLRSGASTWPAARCCRRRACGRCWRGVRREGLRRSRASEARVNRNGSSRVVLGVLAGGLIAGVLDIVYAFILAGTRGGNPVRVLQSVASGVLGAEAFKGGMGTAALGLLLHLGIVVAAAAVYYALARRSALVRRHCLLFGFAFGVGVYLVMNFAILPLSAVPFKIAYSPMSLLQGFVSHGLLVGIPIALCLRRLSFPSPAPA